MVHTPSLDFGDSKEPKERFILFEKIIEDRGSVYSVSVGRVESKEDIRVFLATLKNNKKYVKATHTSWAVRITKDHVVYESKRDDGEVGAGMVILRVLQKQNVTNCIVCVTRWFGGVKLMGDRFTHIQNASVYVVTRMK